MRNIYKKVNKLGNPTFQVTSKESVCKIAFDTNGTIIKASCGNPDNLVLVYSKDQTNENCLKDAMYEMLILSQQCFLEMLNEIKSQPQAACAKDVMAQRSKELKEVAKQALKNASELDSLL